MIGNSKLAYMLRKAKYFTTVDKISSEVKGPNLYVYVGRFEVILYDDGRMSCTCQNHVIYSKFGQSCAHIFSAVWYCVEQTKDIRRI